jgi:hypothetical protein
MCAAGADRRPEADWGPSALLLSIPNGPRLCGCNGRGYSAGEWITASGEWINDRTHGQQFKARFLRTSPVPFGLARFKIKRRRIARD